MQREQLWVGGDLTLCLLPGRPCMKGAATGAIALLHRKSVPDIPGLPQDDVIGLASAFVAGADVRAVAVAERILCFELLLAFVKVLCRIIACPSSVVAKAAPRGNYGSNCLGVMREVARLKNMPNCRKGQPTYPDSVQRLDRSTYM